MNKGSGGQKSYILLKSSEQPLGISHVSMSQKAVMNSHLLPPSRTMLFTYTPISTAVCAAWLVITHGVELHICAGEPLDMQKQGVT